MTSPWKGMDEIPVKAWPVQVGSFFVPLGRFFVPLGRNMNFGYSQTANFAVCEALR